MRLLVTTSLWARVLSSALVVTAYVATGQFAHAQCQREWLPEEKVPGTDGPITASTLWDPDGPGPETSKIVFAGSFSYAGGVRANRIAVYDPQTDEWSALPQQFPSDVIGGATGISVTADGGLVLVGRFTTGTNGPRSYVHRWNRQSWSEIPVGDKFHPYSFVSAVVGMPNGDIVIGGSFIDVGDVSSINVARWDGARWVPWSPTGTGFSVSDSVSALAVTPQGDLLVGGDFANIGNSFWNGLLAKWDGTSWSTLGGGTSSGGGGYAVTGLRVLPNGSVLASGLLATQLGGPVTIRSIGLFDGVTWTNLGAGLFGVEVLSADMSPNGDVMAIGLSAGTEVRYYRRVGSTWTDLGLASNSPFRYGDRATVRSIGADRFVIGGIDLRSTQNIQNFVRWSGSGFVASANGLSSSVLSIARLPDGDLIAGGVFTAIGGQTFNRIARRSGTQWLPLGSGMNNSVNSVKLLPNGHVVAAGSFTAAGGIPASRVAVWDGSAWSPLGSGVDNTVNEIAVMPNGNIVAVGTFRSSGSQTVERVAMWDGQAWLPLGAGLDGTASAVLALPNGNVIVGGLFTTAGGIPATNIARWNGTAWSSLGQGVNGSVNALRLLTNGTIAVGGLFTEAGGTQARYIAVWNGESWASLGSGLNGWVGSLTELDGQLVAGGLTTGAVSISSWDGSQWRTLGEGLRPFRRFTTVADMEVTPSGDLLVAGNFAGSGDVASAFLATWACRCRPDFDANGTLDFFDYLDFVSAFAAGDPRADFDRNGTVDFFDYLEFVASFDRGC